MENRQLRILHIITDLNVGGAEMNLIKLLSNMDRQIFQHEVITLGGAGVLQPKVEALGIPVYTLGMSPNFPNPITLLRLSIHIRRSKPDIVQTWMFHANLVGGIAARLAGSKMIVWGIRNVDSAGLKKATRLIIRLNALLSHFIPDWIICVAETVRTTFAAMGYAEHKMKVIPNGFDLSVYKPDPEIYKTLRTQLDLPASTLLVGIVARYHPVKDFHTFIRAASHIRSKKDDVHFVMIGNRVDSDNLELQNWIAEECLQDRVHLLGQRYDVPELLPALDLLVSSSIGEGFSQVLGEAMACGVPCAVTNVGDSARIVGDTGRVVEPGQSQALAAACLEILTMPVQERQAVGRAARARVEAEYNLTCVSQKYVQFFRDVLNNRNGDAR
jgi:glycosyltransferase involved in cell wall biosynthesis